MYWSLKRKKKHKTCLSILFLDFSLQSWKQDLNVLGSSLPEEFRYRLFEELGLKDVVLDQNCNDFLDKNTGNVTYKACMLIWIL